MERNRWSHLRLSQVLCDCFDYVVQVGSVVEVLSLLDLKVDLVGFLVVVSVEYVVGGDLVGDLVLQHDAGLVRPASTYVLYGVPAAAQEDHRHAKTFHVIHSLCVPPDRQIQMPKLILRQGISATLYDQGIGAI